ncbi:sodium-dependent multivitamin transporter-like isoform X1 [Ptychodera flava]|uniref:sodium-dependent multivitamin transporter-like isoform X1 n=1 Tax=Ptychodera flava TaxID=63121 RepID=UPI00396AA54A
MSGSTTDVIPFGTVDYIVFSTMLAVSTAVGIYQCFAEGGQKSTSRFLVADRSMGCVPIAMSMFVTVTSAIAVMGFPAEMYIHGIQFALSLNTYLWAYPLAAYFFIPVFRSLGITSVYEYMGLRYHLSLRIMCSVIFILQSLLYMATTMVGPALAIEAVQGFEMWKTVLIVGAVATFYTTVGGMKAVIWTDVFQFLVIFGSVLAVAIYGTIQVGGFEYVWSSNDVGDRLKLSSKPGSFVSYVTIVRTYFVTSRQLAMRFVGLNHFVLFNSKAFCLVSGIPTPLLSLYQYLFSPLMITYPDKVSCNRTQDISVFVFSTSRCVNLLFT